MAIKIIKNTIEPIALVISENGRVKGNPIKSKSFKREIKSGKLNKFSYAYDYFSENDQNEHCDTVYSMAWLCDGSDSETIIEESLPMPNLNIVFTILRYTEDLIEEANDDIDEDIY